MTILLVLLAGLGAGLAQTVSSSASAAPAQGISFSFEPRRDAKMPTYIISVTPDGLGRYIEFASQDGPAARPVSLTVSAATLQTILSAAGAIQRNAARPGGCESPRKNLAQTGQKTLRLYHADDSVVCSFNYSEDPALNTGAELFQAIAETLQYSDRLDHEHRFDRLGLDAEIDSLIAEKQAGRAIEIQNIAPALQSIVDDERVMERVRRKAARLLQDAASAPPSAAASAR